MEKIVPLFNELQEILHRANLNNSLQMPQLVVVGAQSTGKSSVLEGIVGKDFLPRGAGIVTRRPIILQLNNTPKDSPEYAEFSHLKGEKIYDWDIVRKTIETETDKVAGTQKAISSSPIIVRIYSPNVVNLNIVDLPGLTKIPIGEQPSDIEQRIRDIVLTYIKNPNTIILAVSAASTDLANSDALKIAREVDPNGDRTIGIITKLDAVDEGTDYMDALDNKLYKLKLGYIGVKNRKQKDLDAGKTIAEAIKDERNFFENHPVYYKYADRMGIPYLTKTLNVTFLQHIKKCLPNIRDNIISLIQEKEAEMAQYGGDPGEELDSKGAKGITILSLLNKFANAYAESINGTYLKATTNELFGGARINYIFKEIYRKAINNLNPLDVLTDEDIRIAIYNSNALRSAIFIPEVAIEILVKQQIARLQDPSIECSQLIYEELRKVLFQINIPEITRYENFHMKINEVMEKVLKDCLVPTNMMIKNLIDIELAYINTTHPDFIAAASSVFSKPPQNPQKHKDSFSEPKEENKSDKSERKSEIKEVHLDVKKVEEKPQSKGFFGNIFSRSNQNKEPSLADKYDEKLDSLTSSVRMSHNYDKGKSDFTYVIEKNEINQFGRTFLPQPQSQLKLSHKPTDKEATEIEIAKKLVTNYFDVVKKNICDSVPKSIIHFLINGSQKACEKELITRLYKEELFDELLAENSFIAKSRQECKKVLASLKNCADILMEIDSKL